LNTNQVLAEVYRRIGDVSHLSGDEVTHRMREALDDIDDRTIQTTARVVVPRKALSGGSGIDSTS
jgi:hypothetical protein